MQGSVDGEAKEPVAAGSRRDRHGVATDSNDCASSGLRDVSCAGGGGRPSVGREGRPSPYQVVVPERTVGRAG